MPFFQNLFNQEFRGNWVMGDRQYSLTFTCPANQNTPDYQVAYNSGPWDFGGGLNILTLNYSWDSDFKNYTKLEINVAGEDENATKPFEIANILNSNATFSSMFIAEENKSLSSVCIKSRQNKKQVRLWISNSGAEQKMRFNKKAGVSELPTYFKRHTIENMYSYPDSVGQLILLDETDLEIDSPIIEEAGFVASEMKEDWELIEGRASGLFTFQKMAVDGNDRITQIIEYPAGARVGDFARKINYTYSGNNINPSTVTEVPYVLKEEDLITP